jgi:hypothetical protein
MSNFFFDFFIINSLPEVHAEPPVQLPDAVVASDEAKTLMADVAGLIRVILIQDGAPLLRSRRQSPAQGMVGEQRFIIIVAMHCEAAVAVVLAAAGYIY